MQMPYERMLRGWVRDIDCMCAACDRWLVHDPPPPFIRRRLFLARRGMRIGRLAFLAILALLGASAFRRR
jgi:hypothetical protein